MKNASVMNELVNISDKIAESTRAKKNAPKDEPGPAADNPHESTAPVVSVPLTPVRNPALLQKRFEEFLRTGKDLSGRLAEQIAALEGEEKNSVRRLDENRAAAAALRTLAEKLAGLESLRSEGFRSTAEQAESCRALEILRLETIKLAPAVERLTGSGEKHSSLSAASDQRILLDSLTFRQIFRVSFIAALPWTLGALAAAALVAAAVIGSFKGWF